MTLFYYICAGIWIATLVSLLRRRDLEFRRKLAWVVAVLVLNVIGVLLYFLIGPRRVRARPTEEAAIDPDAEPVQPEGMAWNPILGENRFPPGEGLNPKADDPAEDSKQADASAPGDDTRYQVSPAPPPAAGS